MSIVHVLYRAILLVRIGLFGEACSPLRAVRVHLEKYTEPGLRRAAVVGHAATFSDYAGPPCGVLAYDERRAGIEKSI